MNKPHKHAQLMLQYAQDAAETDKPWERWEYRYQDEKWKDSDGPLHFYSDFQYRRKPRTININGFEVPEPMREKPELNTQYFSVTVGVTENAKIAYWDDREIDNKLLNLGICHLTREAAEIHAKALLSFTKKEAK